MVNSHSLLELGTGEPTYDLSTGEEAEAELWVGGQPGLCSETLCSQEKPNP